VNCEIHLNTNINTNSNNYTNSNTVMDFIIVVVEYIKVVYSN